MVKKYVITGTCSSGKTTLINMLNQSSYYTIGEVASYLIEGELKKQNEERVLPWTNLHEFQKRVALLQKEWEEEIPSFINTAILDRSKIDGLAYCSESNIKTPKELDKICKNTDYEKVFLLEPLQEHKQTKIRREDKNKALELNKHLTNAYKQKGYEPIRVPAIEPQERLEFILKSM